MKRGFTLVEVIVASWILLTALVASFVGLRYLIKASRENAQFLAAQAYAWETALIWFNKSNDDLNRFALATSSKESFIIPRSECPAIHGSVTGFDAVCTIRVTKSENAPLVLGPSHEYSLDNANGFYIEVDVEWGAKNNLQARSRKRLNGLLGEGSWDESYHIPIRLFKSTLDRSISGI